MKKLYLLLAIALTGCGFVNEKEHQSAVEACKTFGGVRYTIFTLKDKSFKVRCVNGHYIEGPIT